MSNWNLDYGEESVIFHNAATGVEVRTPAYPKECDYVRVVLTGAEAHNEVTGETLVGDCELVYWNVDEWREEGEDVMGAIMGVIKQVYEGSTFEVEFGYKAFD